MSHLIESQNGRHEIAYVGQTPWHGLGQALTPNEPIEVWQREAGLDWQALTAPVLFRTDAASEPTQVDDRFVIYRNDTNHPLGLVTDRYRIHQPNEILDFFNTLVQSAGFTLEVAGAIKGGKRIWALANVNREACVLGDDAVRGYLLLSTSFDGSTATVGQFTSIRVVCNNTLSAADREASPSRVAITHGSRFDASIMRDRLGLVVSGFDGMMDGYRALARKSVNAAFVNQFLQKFYPSTVNEQTGQQKAHRGYVKVMELFEGRGMGTDLEGTRGTAWGLLNAVTQYVDHERGHNVDSRLSNAWFGNGNRMKQESEAILLATI
jgi:phage/plasmid-like protein (TIGR03299 family)